MDKGKTIHLAIEDEVRESYLNYAMSVIVSRALPDVRDGLKPVHRRILYAMNEMGLRADRSFVKAGRIVGDVLGKYHPHGDMSIYDALVRLAQDFSLRYTVINGQGNFGSLDGDPPAAMRYTEAKLEKIADEMLRDIDRETVDFTSNYDDSLMEPTVLPAAVPFLILNGGSGIAVGMATNMAPHNLKETCQAIKAYIDNPAISISELMKYIKGPDFPGGGIIFGRRGIKNAFTTGKGQIVVRAKLSLETSKKGKDIILISEIPYMVNKASLMARIADLIKEKKIDGIIDLRDESGRGDPVRIIIELRKGIIPKVVINQLFTHTPLQSNFNVNNLALVNGRPKLLNLKEMIEYFVLHRKEVVTRRTKYDLRKAKERAHILVGLKIALENIDEVVEMIKKSENVEQARTKLMNRFNLMDIQAQAILDMKLQRLTSLETQKILDELAELQKLMQYLQEILADERKIFGVIKDETGEIEEKYGDERQTEIIDEEIEEFDIEDLIVKEDMVILISHNGLIKRIPVSAYRRQTRGGRGSASITMREEDFMEQLFIASTHEYILFITNEGKAFWIKVHEIPEGSKVSRGQSIKMLLNISANEEIATVLSFKSFDERVYVLMATSKGIVKKVDISDFCNAKTRGIVAIKMDAGDKLVAAKITTGNDDIILVTRGGNALRFHENQIRNMGRASRGVTGIRFSGKDELAGVLSISEGEEMILVSEKGFGKRMECSVFTPHGRGTRGQICYKISEKTGELVGILSASMDDDLVCITSQGNMIKLRIEEVPIQGKNAVGVRVVNLVQPDVVVGIAKAVKEE